MNLQLKQFNSQEVAQLLNVNVSTIKRWTEEGKLECLKTPGGHRKFLMSQINKFLEYNNIKTAWSGALHPEDDPDLNSQILKRNFGYLQSFLFEEAIGGKHIPVRQVLQGLYLNQTAPARIFDELITPVLHRIGDSWEKKEITVLTEHIASQIIRDEILMLKTIIDFPVARTETALLMLLSTEMHDIALKLTEVLLEIRGFHVLLSGQMTPTLNIEKMIDKYKPDRIYISGTVVDDLNLLQAEFDKIGCISEKKAIRVYIGGKAFDAIEFAQFKHVKRLANFGEIAEQ
ncbi:helix-turn-helix domain-containing protein [candidate division KSB1 bacterium]|nr:helix-turn-helix domain-containing protein [candidate division KSB1 bacterium]